MGGCSCAVEALSLEPRLGSAAEANCRNLLTFMECTAISMRPSSRASSISFVKRPLPPMSASGWFSTLSPVVLMMLISRAPSSLSSGKASCRSQVPCFNELLLNNWHQSHDACKQMSLLHHTETTPRCLCVPDDEAGYPCINNVEASV